MISVQLRLRILAGASLGIEYQAQPVMAFVILAAASVAAWGLGKVLDGRDVSRPYDRTRGLSGMARTLAAALAAFVGIAVLVPDLSLLQLAYFVIAAVVLALLVARPYRPVMQVLEVGGNGRDVSRPNGTLEGGEADSAGAVPTERGDGGKMEKDGVRTSFAYAVPTDTAGSGIRLEDDLRGLWANRLLIGLWTDYNVRSRYSQTLLGILWIVLLPVSTALVFSLVFGVFLNVNMVGDVPYLAFFLTGLTFWAAFNQGITGAVNSILSKMTLINQVYFPREILVIVRLAEAMVDTFFTFVTLLILNLLLGILPGLDTLLIVPVFAIQVVFTAGVMLIVSSLTVFVRDVPQLVGVAMQILFYLTPILYPAASIPEGFRFLTLINPLVPLIDAYRGIVLDHQMPDAISLYYPLVAGVTLLYLGYRTFKRGEMTMQDYV